MSSNIPVDRRSASAGSDSWPAGITAPEKFQAALDFARNEDGHLFVTGRAGTGKSTLLRCLRDMITQEAVVLAPTGLAAVNVGGQTIHSFFGFPPRLIRSDDIRRSRNGGLMRRLKVIIIDEVSMVRSDLMWAIDQSLRMNRGRPREAFGGVRLLLFGDLHQLPPVVQGGEVAEHLESAHGGAVLLPDPGADRRCRHVAHRARPRVPAKRRAAHRGAEPHPRRRGDGGRPRRAQRAHLAHTHAERGRLVRHPHPDQRRRAAHQQRLPRSTPRRRDALRGRHHRASSAKPRIRPTPRCCSSPAPR